MPLKKFWLTFIEASALFAVPSMILISANPSEQNLKLVVGKLLRSANAAFASFAFGVLAPSGFTSSNCVSTTGNNVCSVGADLEANESRFRNAPAITSLTLSLFFGLAAIRGIELTAGYEVLPYLASILLQMASCVDGIACKIVSAFCSFAKYLVQMRREITIERCHSACDKHDSKSG